MSGKAAYFPRGLLIATGEDLPRGASLLGRLLILEMKRGDVDLSNLSLLQDHARKGKLSAAMAGFIQWLAPQIDDLKQALPPRVRKLRDDNIGAFKNAHPRAPDLYASLYTSADLLIQYLEQVEAINAIRANTLADDIDENLRFAMIDQSQFQKQADEVARFMDLLRACFSSGEVHVSDYITQGPPNEKPFIFGWRKPNESADLAGCGSLIGWFNYKDEQILLDAEATFKAVQRFANSQNDPLLMSQTTLWKRVAERGLLLDGDVDTATGKKRYDPKKVVAGQRRRVRVLDMKLVTGSDSD